MAVLQHWAPGKFVLTMSMFAYCVSAGFDALTPQFVGNSIVCQPTVIISLISGPLTST